MTTKMEVRTVRDKPSSSIYDAHPGLMDRKTVERSHFGGFEDEDEDDESETDEVCELCVILDSILTSLL